MMRATGRVCAAAVVPPMTKYQYLAADECVKRAWFMWDDAQKRQDDRHGLPLPMRLRNGATMPALRHLPADYADRYPPKKAAEPASIVWDDLVVRQSTVDGLDIDEKQRVLDGMVVHHLARAWHRIRHSRAILVKEESFERAEIRTTRIIGNHFSGAAPTRPLALQEPAFSAKVKLPDGSMCEVRTRCDMLHWLPQGYTLQCGKAKVTDPKGQWELIEAKSVVSVDSRYETLLKDVAWQQFVLRKAGVPVTSTGVLHLSRAHIRRPMLATSTTRPLLDSLFALTPLPADSVDSRDETVLPTIQRFHAVVENRVDPATGVTGHRFDVNFKAADTARREAESAAASTSDSAAAEEAGAAADDLLALAMRQPSMCSKACSTCPFNARCVPSPEQVRNSVFTVPRLRPDVKRELWNRGYHSVKDVAKAQHAQHSSEDSAPPGRVHGSHTDRELYGEDNALLTQFNGTQQQYIAAVEADIPLVDGKELRGFIDGLTYPVLCLDFETAAWAVPTLAKTAVYENVPFQFSCDVYYKDIMTETPEHFEFLHLGADYDPTADPRGHVLDALVRMFEAVEAKALDSPAKPKAVVETKAKKKSGKKKNSGVEKYVPSDALRLGTIVAHNAAFEKAVLTKLKSWATATKHEYPTRYHPAHLDFGDTLTALRRSTCAPAAEGSFSLKKLLPAFAPHMATAYGSGQVSHGAAAAAEYRTIASQGRNGTTPAEREALRKELLKYCELDTKAVAYVLRGAMDFAPPADLF